MKKNQTFAEKTVHSTPLFRSMAASKKGLLLGALLLPALAPAGEATDLNLNYKPQLNWYESGIAPKAFLTGDDMPSPRPHHKRWRALMRPETVAVDTRIPALQKKEVAYAAPYSAGKSFECPHGAIALINVPKGQFTMRFQQLEAGKPQVREHQVTLSKEFWLGRYELTETQFCLLLDLSEALPSKALSPKTKQAINELIELRTELAKGREDYPATFLPQGHLTWNHAQALCGVLTETAKKAGTLPKGYVYRLPTEAEWVYAAQGGSESRGSLYAGGTDLNQVAWHGHNSGLVAQPVGIMGSNELGFHDMSGNMAEWCEDAYGEYPRDGSLVDPVIPPVNQQLKRMQRGGAFCHVPYYSRIDSRNARAENMSEPQGGIRIALGGELKHDALVPRLQAAKTALYEHLEPCRERDRLEKEWRTLPMGESGSPASLTHENYDEIFPRRAGEERDAWLKRVSRYPAQVKERSSVIGYPHLLDFDGFSAAPKKLTAEELDTIKNYVSTRKSGYLGFPRATDFIFPCARPALATLNADLYYELTGDTDFLNELIRLADPKVDCAFNNRNRLFGKHPGEQGQAYDFGCARDAKGQQVMDSSSLGFLHSFTLAAMRISHHPELWDKTIPDGDPLGYGKTYRQRMMTYITTADQLWVKFMEPAHLRARENIASMRGFDTHGTPYNRSGMTLHSLAFLAEAMDCAGLDKERTAYFDQLVRGSIQVWLDCATIQIKEDKRCLNWPYHENHSMLGSEELGHAGITAANFMHIHRIGRYNDKLTPELMTIVANAGYQASGGQHKAISGDDTGYKPVDTKFSHWIGYSVYHRPFYEYLMSTYQNVIKVRQESRQKAPAAFAEYEKYIKSGDLLKATKVFQRYEGYYTKSNPLFFLWGTYWRHQLAEPVAGATSNR